MGAVSRLQSVMKPRGQDTLVGTESRGTHTMGNRRSLQMTIMAALLVVSVQATGAGSGESRPYRFGVFPYLSPLKMDAVFAPVSQKLGELLGQKVRFRTTSTMSTFVERLRTGHYDFAILQPVLYPLLKEGMDYVPIAKFEESLTAQILVPASSSIQSIDDLRGKIVATPPLLGPIFHLADHELQKANIALGRDVTLRKNKSIDACFQQMVIGRADACLAPSFSVPQIQQTLGLDLRILLQSDSVPNRLLIAHKQLSADAQEKILKAFVDLRDVSGGGRLLAAMNTTGFVAFEYRDYEKVQTTLRHLQQEHHSR